ncbi:pentapeptide repeat-containing protein [Myxacorys almedinensis]|uniref:CHAT domain-containing protein n=1 Tax=Myxacorys almedinensis A TaxID=2690445 RepID=A0A8J7Z7X1_9CYAN|nr:pentapeptide repeat-containing protein [Myxacorys almedinensis]NDJ17145.1 CHAT domain-containing protein [Myxacorys almedinensis A]
MPSAPSSNFSHQNLQGRSFQGQNLVGANFSHADLRGADFTQAVLVGARFSHARAGLTAFQALRLTLAALGLAALAGFASTFTTIFAAYLLFPYSLSSDQVLASGVVLGLSLILSIVTMRYGLGAAFGGAIAAGVSLGAVLGSVTKTLDGVAAGAITVTVTAVVAIAIVGVCAIAITAARVISGTIAGYLTAVMMVVGGAPGANIGIVVGLAVANVITTGTVSNARLSAMSEATIAAIVGSLAGAGLSHYLSRRALAGDPKFAAVWSRAIACSAIGGTRFRNADLTDATFTQARLNSTDMSNATLTQTNFYQAKHLDRAKVQNTILADPQIRALVTTHQGGHTSYARRDLRGANLAGADLRGADLSQADLSDATLAGACLAHANLTRAHAIATTFRHATLTGACIEAWNIDSTTELEQVVCDYVYLRHPQHERRPSSGTFAPGDFADLFQEMIHTIDLLFRNGINQKVFNYSLHQLRVENDGIVLSIRSLEQKRNGAVVVRVDVPAEADKAKLHADFTHYYGLALQATEAKYQAELRAKDEQIGLYREQLADWKDVAQVMAARPAQTEPTPLNTVSKLVVLQIGAGDWHTGFPVTLQIGAERPLMQWTKGRLAANPDLPRLYNDWQRAYRRCLHAPSRLEIPDTQVTNVSRQEFFQACDPVELGEVDRAAHHLKHHLNHWLNADSFRSLKERLLEQLAPSDSIRIILQTDDCQLRRLPFHVWDFCDRYPTAEIALSSPDFEQKSVRRFALRNSEGSRVPPVASLPLSRVKILAILGDSTGIDLNTDQAMLDQLPTAEVTFLVEPQRQALSDHLWAQPWDILFFAGHSCTQADHQTGEMSINRRDRLTIAQLKHGLNTAIAHGLSLAVFNSCDGLGLAHDLADLHIPQMIVMREPVPDLVAQAFLRHFLHRFSQGAALSQAVREARETLQGLEDRFPYATWLPTLYQSSAASDLTWEQLQRH